MRAFRFHSFGHACECGTLDSDLPIPQLQNEHDVIVRVAACSLNPVDYKRALGSLNFLGTPSLPLVPGMDVSGTVEEAGAAAQRRFPKGTRVLLARTPFVAGGLAEFVRAKEKELFPIPDRVSYVDACTLGCAGVTAWEGLRQLQPGQDVLVVGASGGVGTFAVQIARERGANRIFASCSARNADLAKSLGATHVIDYTSMTSYTDVIGESQVDIVLDCVGGDSIWEDARRTLKHRGRYVTLVGPVQHVGSEVLSVPDAARIALRILWKKISGHRYSMVTSLPADGAARLVAMIESGSLQPVIDSTVPFSQESVHAAFKRLASHRARGKIVIKVSSLADQE